MLLILFSLLVFLQSLLVSAFLTPIARRVAPVFGMIDVPNLSRKQHTAPIPRSGGLAIFFSFWGCLLVNLFLLINVAPNLSLLPQHVLTLAANIPLRISPLIGILVGSSIIFLLGVLDDRFNLPAKLRLLVQILAVLPLLMTDVTVKMFLPEPMSWLLTIFWVVFLTNSLNFLDNMNGLTSGLCVIMAAVLGFQSYLAGEFYMMAMFGLLSGSVMGFWFFNFPKASIFLGDSGSTTLGFLFGALTTVSTYYDSNMQSQLPVLMPVLVMGVPLFDTVTVMWIRWRRGKPLMEGDTNHFSHRLVSLGMSRTEAVVYIYGVALCVGLAAVVLRPLDWRYGLVQATVIGLVFLGIYWMERVSRKKETR